MHPALMLILAFMLCGCTTAPEAEVGWPPVDLRADEYNTPIFQSWGLGLETDDLVGNWTYLEDPADIARIRQGLTQIADKRSAKCGLGPLEAPLQDDLLYKVALIIMQCSTGTLHPILPTEPATELTPEELESAVMAANGLLLELNTTIRDVLNRSFGSVVDMELAARIDHQLHQGLSISRTDSLLRMARGEVEWNPRLDWTQLNWILNMLEGLKLVAEEFPWSYGTCMAPPGAADRLVAALARARQLADVHAHPDDWHSQNTGPGELVRLSADSQGYIARNWTPGILAAQSQADHLLAYQENFVTESLPTLAEAELILDRYAQEHWSLTTELVITVEMEGLKETKTGVTSPWEYRPELALRFMVLPQVDWHFDEVVCTPDPSAHPDGALP